MPPSHDRAGGAPDGDRPPDGGGRPSLTLHLLRHAKSDWGTSAVDHDRPLNGRGERARHVIAEHLRHQRDDGAPGQPVDRIVCSTARRAQQTVEPVVAALGCPLELSRAVYGARVDELLMLCQELDDDDRSVLLVGHNPGFEELSWLLTGETGTYPTAALGTIALGAERWADVRPGDGRLLALVNARGLQSDSGGPAGGPAG